MGDAKRIIVKPISSTDANKIVKTIHYSGKVVQNSQLHLGVFLDGKCGGAMQFGPSLRKDKLIGLVLGTKWNEFIELNRMAFADWLPRNSESRAIGYVMKWISKNYPFIKWVVSFADATQCGDGTIYRASGFVLTGIEKNRIQIELPDGTIVSDINLKLRMSPTVAKKWNPNEIPRNQRMKELGINYLPGYMLRYIYFLDPTAKDRLTVPILPFSEIERRGAGMYKGKQIKRDKQATGPDQGHSGGAAPTVTLQG